MGFFCYGKKKNCGQGNYTGGFPNIFPGNTAASGKKDFAGSSPAKRETSLKEDLEMALFCFLTGRITNFTGNAPATCFYAGKTGRSPFCRPGSRGITRWIPASGEAEERGFICWQARTPPFRTDSGISAMFPVINSISLRNMWRAAEKIHFRPPFFTGNEGKGWKRSWK